LGVHTSFARAGFFINTPSGLAPGDTFFVVFLDSTKTDATSADISTYNNAVASAASGLTYPGGAIGVWRVIGATESVNASTPLFTNTTTPVYDVLGSRLADTGVEYLQFGNSPDIDQNGVGLSDFGRTWTGLNRHGDIDSGQALGDSDVTLGLAGSPLSGNTISTVGLKFVGGNPTSSFDLYGYALFTVGPTTPAAPEPSTLALLGIGAAGLLGYRWGRRKQATA
jgi:hypothetical protein